MSAFADAEIIRLARTEFIPVTGDDWYQRRRKDDEGDFFKKIYEQTPRKGPITSTKQGIYLFTADGTVLGFNNAGNSPEAVKQLLTKALSAFQALPAERRLPGKVTLAPWTKIDPKYARSPPKDGAVVQVFTRILDQEGDKLKLGTCDFVGGTMAGRDFLWITNEELTIIGNTAWSNGKKFALPQSLVQRIARFHLVDNTRGEPDFWQESEVLQASVFATVERLGKVETKLMLEGTFHMASKATDAQKTRRFQGRMMGTMTFGGQRCEGLSLTVLGEHEGASTHTQKGVREGRSLLGLTFDLVPKPTPSQTIPPQAARDLDLYFGKD